MIKPGGYTTLARTARDMHGRIERYRGRDLPAGMVYLLRRAAGESDHNNRFVILGLVLAEASLHSRFDLQVKYARYMLSQYPGIVSRLALAESLCDDGNFRQGVAQARRAFLQAVADRMMTNNASLTYLQLCIDSRHVERLNRALRLIGRTYIRGKPDCVWSWDWLDAAWELGASAPAIDRVVELHGGYAED